MIKTNDYESFVFLFLLYFVIYDMVEAIRILEDFP